MNTSSGITDRLAAYAAALTLAVALSGCGDHARVAGACIAAPPVPDPAHPIAGMTHLAGGEFLMGAASLRPEEGPARQVRVGGFWIDRTEVTNADFARFVKATGYKTMAEKPLDAALYPTLTAEQRRPSSLLFVGTDHPTGDPGQWWRVVAGADWRHPKGPDSSIAGLDDLPVVHIAWADAMAYARWLGRDLPTEAEWEYAARGGLEGKRYAWGDQPSTADNPRANTWQGEFPISDSGADGYKARPAPVGCFPPNGYGLYDMAGNVWQWTRDWYRPGLASAKVIEHGGPSRDQALDPGEPGVAKHVIKGGSYLCAPNYCFRYRPAARTPGPPDSGAGHIGFRTVLRDALPSSSRSPT